MARPIAPAAGVGSATEATLERARATGDMTLFAEYGIRCEALPLVEVADAVPEAEMTVEMHPNGDGYRLFVVHLTAGPIEDVEAAFESAGFVGEYSLIGAVGDRRRYKIVPGVSMEGQLGDAVDDLDDLRALAATDFLMEEIRVTRTGWVQAGWFADRDVLERFRAFWQRNGGFRLRRLSREADPAAPADGLTDCQREALLTAREMGYFEVPRTASLGDVADELGITASSLSERLRRAQDRLVERAIETPINARTAESQR